MDLDSHIKTLLRFKNDVEKIFNPATMERLLKLAEADTEVSEALRELPAHVVEISEAVTALQQDMEAFKPKLAAVEKLADPAVLDLLDWLAGNRQSIEVLLTIGDDIDPNQGTGGGGGAGGSGSASGSGTGGAGGDSGLSGGAGAAGGAGSAGGAPQSQ